MALVRREGWFGLFLSGATVVCVLMGDGCLSMPTGAGDSADGVSREPRSLVADSLTGTWLVSLDTADLAPFEIILFEAPYDSGSGRLLGSSHVPEFAARMGMNVIRPGPLIATLDRRSFAIHGLALGDRQLAFTGAQCGADRCGT